MDTIEQRTVMLDDGTIEVVELGSGNIFADLGLPNAHDLQFKTDLVHEIRRVIAARKLTAAQAAKAIGMDRGTFSKMIQGQFLDLSVDRLFEVLNRLGRRVEVRVVADEGPPTRAQTLLVV